jgi:hypothetical protein
MVRKVRDSYPELKEHDMGVDYVVFSGFGHRFGDVGDVDTEEIQNFCEEHGCIFTIQGDFWGGDINYYLLDGDSFISEDITAFPRSHTVSADYNGDALNECQRYIKDNLHITPEITFQPFIGVTVC